MIIRVYYHRSFALFRSGRIDLKPSKVTYTQYGITFPKNKERRITIPWSNIIAVEEIDG